EHEHDARRRLLENLEQRVPRFAREHVGFVDDIDLVTVVAGWRVHRPLAQFARVVDTTVRCRIDFDDVHRSRSGPDATTTLAFTAWLAAGRAVVAVERHGEHACERGLANTLRAGQ